MLAPHAGGKPSGDLAKAIDKKFGSFDVFKEQFTTAASNVFGSGWAWLAVDPSGDLSVITTPNQDNPVSQGLKPIFGIDVWEHAYYLKYQNRRPDVHRRVLERRVLGQHRGQLQKGAVRGMAAKRIVVTGGSGKAGRAIVRELLEHGYEVLNVDLAPPAERLCPFLKADLCKSGEVFESLKASTPWSTWRPPGPRSDDGRGDVPHQRGVDVQRFCRRHSAAVGEGRLGFQRDDPRPAL